MENSAWSVRPVATAPGSDSDGAPAGREQFYLPRFIAEEIAEMNPQGSAKLCAGFVLFTVSAFVAFVLDF